MTVSNVFGVKKKKKEKKTNKNQLPQPTHFFCVGIGSFFPVSAIAIEAG